MVSCGGDDDGNTGGTLNWNGEYQTYGTINKTKVDFTAKTITGAYDSKGGTWDGSAVISNVTVGSTTDFPPISGSISHSVKCWTLKKLSNYAYDVIARRFATSPIFDTLIFCLSHATKSAPSS